MHFYGFKSTFCVYCLIQLSTIFFFLLNFKVFSSEWSIKKWHNLCTVEFKSFCISNISLFHLSFVIYADWELDYNDNFLEKDRPALFLILFNCERPKQKNLMKNSRKSQKSLKSQSWVKNGSTRLKIYPKNLSILGLIFVVIRLNIFTWVF